MFFFPFKRHTRGQKSAMSQNARVLQNMASFFKHEQFSGCRFLFFPPKNSTTIFWWGILFSSSYSPFFGQRKDNKNLLSSTTSVFLHIFPYLWRAFSFPTPSGCAKGTEGHQARSLAIHPTQAATSLHPDETYEVAGGWMVSSPGFHGGCINSTSLGVFLLYLRCSLCLKECKNMDPLQETPKR